MSRKNRTQRVAIQPSETVNLTLPRTDQPSDAMLATLATPPEQLAQANGVPAPAVKPAKARKSCLISRAQFRAAAKPLGLVLDGKQLPLLVKEFSTGSLGWNANGKVYIEVGGVTVECQLGLNLTINHSKELPQ